jgi:hypothetical protein
LLQENIMNLAQIIEALPPRVYLRSGELVVHFSTPDDLASRIAETEAALSALDRLDPARPDTRGRGKTTGRSSSSTHAGSSGAMEIDNAPNSSARASDGKED